MVSNFILENHGIVAWFLLRMDDWAPNAAILLYTKPRVPILNVSANTANIEVTFYVTKFEWCSFGNIVHNSIMLHSVVNAYAVKTANFQWIMSLKKCNQAVYDRSVFSSHVFLVRIRCRPGALSRNRWCNSPFPLALKTVNFSRWWCPMRDGNKTAKLKS